MSTTMAITTSGLTKAYGQVQALRGVDLAVEQGQIFGFLGPNGAGKTTAIRCLLDLIRPQAGAIRVLGLDPQADPVAVRARVGYLPGELSLDTNYTAEQTLRYFNNLRGNQTDWNFVSRLAERLHLNLAVPIKNLSKGNKQKVGIVQALMSRPELLLLDEPTAGLDPLMQQEVYRLLKEARTDGATVFFSSHILSEVEAIADHIAIIRDGLIVEEAEPHQLVSMTLRRIRIRFQEAVNPAPLADIPGVLLLAQNELHATVHPTVHATVQVEGELDGLIKALAAYPVSDLETERPSLEEIFLAYYEGEKAIEEVQDVG